MTTRTFWQSTAPALPVLAETSVAASCDVVVIGAGLTGLSVALHLAREGRSVQVLERDRVGSGASMRNGGMTLTGLKLSPPELLSAYGEDLGVRLYRASLDAVDFAEQLVRRENIDCELERRGALWAAYSARHYRTLAAHQELLRERFDHDTHLISKEELSEELGSPLYHGGLVDPKSAGLHPGRLVAGLLASVLARGVGVHEAVEVTGVRRRRSDVEVTTTRGTVRCGEVVVATNGYTPSFLRALRRRVIPIGSYIIVTRPLDEAVWKSLIPRGRMVYDSKHFLYYFRLVEGGRLLFGGRTSFRPIGDDEAARRLRLSMIEVFPQLEGVELDYRWSGNVGFTFDQLPHLGRSGDLYYAYGYCGHGVAMSLYAGKHLTELITTGSTSAPFAELLPPGRFYYRERAWFLPLAGYYYEIADRLARRAG